MFSLLLGLLAYSLVPWSDATFGIYRPLFLPAEIRRLTKFRNDVEFANYFGYEMETYSVHTTDGYTLKLYRLPSAGGKPILVMHGLAAASTTWLMSGTKTPALPFLLRQQGYDVWLGNARGTTNGLKHDRWKSRRDGEFWRFSFHEIGLYDLPAIIDFILDATQFQQLSYIGHSQGCTVFFVMASMLPAYAEKVKIIHALAPAVFMSHLRSAFVPMFRTALKSLRYPYLGTFDLRMIGMQQLCVSSQFALMTCLHTLGQFVGNNFENINKTMFPVYLQHVPIASSIHQLLHYAQGFKSGEFGMLDIDYLRHRKIKSKPYPLSNITTPVALYYAKNDLLVAVSDVQKLKSKLANVVEDYLVPNRRWNHIDFITGMDAKKMLYMRVLKVQQLFEESESAKIAETTDLEESELMEEEVDDSEILEILS